jgi:hypothetical protein
MSISHIKPRPSLGQDITHLNINSHETFWHNVLATASNLRRMGYENEGTSKQTEKTSSKATYADAQIISY